MPIRLAFTTGFGSAIRKKRLASLLDIKAYIEDVDLNHLTPKDYESLESIGNELQAFYSSISVADQMAMENLIKKLSSSVKVLQVKEHKASSNSLQCALTHLKSHLNRIVKSELGKMNNGLMVKGAKDETQD